LVFRLRITLLIVNFLIMYLIYVITIFLEIRFQYIASTEERSKLKSMKLTKKRKRITYECLIIISLEY